MKNETHMLKLRLAKYQKQLAQLQREKIDLMKQLGRNGHEGNHNRNHRGGTA